MGAVARQNLLTAYLSWHGTVITGWSNPPADASRLVPRLVQFSNESGINATTNSDSMRSVRSTHRCGRILDRFPPRVGALARVFRGIEISFRRLKRAQLEALVFRPFRHAISTLAPQWRRRGAANASALSFPRKFRALEIVGECSTPMEWNGVKRSRVFRVVESGNCHLESSSILKRNFYINCSSRKKFANGRDRPFLIFARVSCKIGSLFSSFSKTYYTNIGKRISACALLEITPGKKFGHGSIIVKGTPFYQAILFKSAL